MSDQVITHTPMPAMPDCLKCRSSFRVYPSQCKAFGPYFCSIHRWFTAPHDEKLQQADEQRINELGDLLSALALLDSAKNKLLAAREHVKSTDLPEAVKGSLDEGIDWARNIVHAVNTHLDGFQHPKGAR